MYQSSFGTKKQISFNSESEYYEFLGYLSKNDRSTKLVWENNNEQGAWAEEGRILFFKNTPDSLRASLSKTEGVGNIIFRVNCNEFIETIRRDHKFALGEYQRMREIMATIPKEFIKDFTNGLNL